MTKPALVVALAAATLLCMVMLAALLAMNRAQRRQRLRCAGFFIRS